MIRSLLAIVGASGGCVMDRFAEVETGGFR
jgi:hypothetical protein